MRRRKFIQGLATCAAWPLAARAQQPAAMPRIAVLVPFDPANSAYEAACLDFVDALAKLGRVDGQNVRIDIRGAGSADEIRQYAAALNSLSPNVILATGVSTVVPLQRF